MEREQEEEEEEEDEDEDSEEDDHYLDDIELDAQLLLSPGAASQASQMSGTTVMTTASAITTHSEDERNSLTPVLVLKFLPDLLASSCEILDLLAPPGISPEVAESIVRELNMVNSLQAKFLRHAEKKFGNDREFYGSDDYINPSYIYKALFRGRAVDISKFRPDPIFHAANVATLVKDIFITPKVNSKTSNMLLNLDTIFPELFLREFDEDAKFGNSSLRNETFELGLEIRTQCAITALFARRDERWDPEETVLSLFFSPLHSRQMSPQISYFDDVLEHAETLPIMRAGPANSEEEDERIISRVREIQIALQSTEDGDALDFERLDEVFPWTGFLTQVAVWGRKRIEEIKSDINPPKGVDDIRRPLIKAFEQSNPEAELGELHEPSSPPAMPRQQPPARTIIPGNAGQK